MPSFCLQFIHIHSTSKWSHSTFCTSSSVPSVWRGSPWSHPGWWGPPEVLLDARTLSDCRQRESFNTTRQVSVKNHMKTTEKMKSTWKCTPVDSMIFVAPLRCKKQIIQQQRIQVTLHNVNILHFSLAAVVQSSQLVNHVDHHLKTARHKARQLLLHKSQKKSKCLGLSNFFRKQKNHNVKPVGRKWSGPSESETLPPPH